ncbi:hypothetical protein NP233_g12702 [Leucocoprinus birnbaumii]|uniref:Transposase family Tnp2 protein n=1 Tax=Leucocoprinus birnbaumii TaxID=56174 RepID=A0AAD5YPR7_9AGAR|nr:hypothetical protein NP233_g12702 [Leucocoprinus birnbaumii]
MPHDTKGKSKQSSKKDPRHCDCPKCVYNTEPIPYTTWLRHQCQLEREVEQLGEIQAGASRSTQASGSGLGLQSSRDQGEAQSTWSRFHEPDRGDNEHTESDGGHSEHEEIFEEMDTFESLNAHLLSPTGPPSPAGHPVTIIPPPSPTPFIPPAPTSLPPDNNASEQLGGTEPVDQGGEEFTDDAEPETRIHISREDKRITDRYIAALKNAKLDDSGLTLQDIQRLRNPPANAKDLSADPSLKYSLKYYLDTLNASNDTFTSVIKTSSEIQEEQGTDLEFLSHWQTKNRIMDMASIATIKHHMCPEGCIAYTGPLKDLEQCPTCGTSRWNPQKLRRGTKAPAQTFTTITLGTQLQALYSTPEIAQQMRYRRDKTHDIQENIPPSPQNPNGPPAPDRLEDYVHGSDYLQAVHEGEINDNDILLMLSLDGAQLYEHRPSDCWMYIWVVLELGPDRRYKKTHVLPGGFIPGPNKPKHLDSFLFPSLYHIAALQNEGLKIWDASMSQFRLARPVVYLATADAPGMVYLSGLVGHSGARGCRNYCEVKWRHKPNGSHYYPNLHLPDNYHSNQSPNFPEIYHTNLRRVLKSSNDFETVRKETGISKASLFSGFFMPLGVPGVFPLDIMHLLALNIPDLLIGLWRGTLKCDTKAGDDIKSWDWVVLKDTRDNKVWTAHGKRVAELSKCLPSSYDRPPRNPAEKLNSGYKASEFMVYLYGYLPALLEGILPTPYLQNFYKLVRGVRLVSQHSPSIQNLREAHKCFIEFLTTFEQIYVQRKISRMHYVRQCLHTLWHLAPETMRLGPPGIYAQWTMERLIGIMGGKIALHSDPYENLTEIGKEICAVNSLFCKYPSLDRSNHPLPHTARPLAHGYTLLHPHEKTHFRIEHPAEQAAYNEYLQRIHFNITETTCTRHARLLLPNGQKVRTAWKEDQRADS